MSALDGVRLVAFDLDGTLLPSTKVLPERARRVTAGLRERGIDVVLATGKGWTLTERYALDMGVAAPCVALEGALVALPGGPPLRRLVVGAAERAHVAGVVHGLRLGWFFTPDGSRIHASGCLAGSTHLLRIWDPDVALTDAPLAAPELGDAHVLHLIGAAEDVDGAHARLAVEGPADVELFRAEFWDGVQQLQVRPRGTGKHHALRYVLETRGVAAAEMMACGDWWNDVEMLRMAGVAVAPSDAVEGVRAAAHHVVPGTCDDEAVLRFVEEQLERL